jgi:hypothetical protein
MKYESNRGRRGYAGRRIPGLLLSYGRLVLRPLVRSEQGCDSRLGPSKDVVSRSRA